MMTNASLRAVTKKLGSGLLKRQILVKNRILVGTHHKTGTVWFANIFRDISSRLGLRFVRSPDERFPPDGWDIFQNSHSAFDLQKLGQFRGLHVIRDPRDQIISATFYHEKSAEAWLHVRMDEFGGMTYQEKINSFSCFDDKMLFEMEHSAYHNIMSMKEFDHTDERFLTARFEELITDYKLEKFEQIFRFLGFRRVVVGWCLVAAYRNSLFSGAVESTHVRSGKPKQWPEYFKPVHRNRFEELFGDVLQKLGYDEEWDSID